MSVFTYDVLPCPQTNVQVALRSKRDRHLGFKGQGNMGLGNKGFICECV